MDEHICSLAEAVLVTTDEGGGSDFMFPIIDVLDKVSSSSTSDPPLRRKCSLALDRICAAYGILPTRYPNIGNLIVAGEGPGDCGGTSDVWRGEADGNPVAVKVTRRYSTVPVARAQEQFYHEVLVWGRLSHPNILPFLGVDASTFPLAAVSTWMQNGNLKEYLLHFPSASRPKLLLDASRGLEYMHGLDYVHGDIKSFNVLVDGNHSACLADFGSSFILPVSEPDAKAFHVPVEGHAFSVRWLPPEFICPEEFGLSARVRSKELDIYAFAMLMYEAFSGLLPFGGCRDEGVILQVLSGVRPNRPQGDLDLGPTDAVWWMMQACWDSSDRRPSISRIVSCLESSVTPTTKARGSVERTERGDPRSTSASEPESEAAQPNLRKKVFRKLNRLFQRWPTQR